MQIDPLYIFVFAGLFSPGPNVILLTASGARFGFYRTIPHVLGVVIGVGIIAAVTGLGVGSMLATWPQLAYMLKVIAAAWILWMAWKLAQAASQPQSDAPGRPFTVLQATLFQWINPKIWAVALVATSGYGIGLSPMAEAARLAFAFSGINLFVCLFWSYAGSLLAFLLRSPIAWAVFLRIMATILATTAVLIFV